MELQALIIKHPIPTEGPTFAIETVKNPTRYDSFVDAVNAMRGLEEFEVTNVHHLIRAAASIARESRRGLGNVIITNDAHQVFGEFSKVYPKTLLINDESVDGTYLTYSNPDCFFRMPNGLQIDVTIIEKDGGFYLHPQYKQRTRKIIFK